MTVSMKRTTQLQWGVIIFGHSIHAYILYLLIVPMSPFALVEPVVTDKRVYTAADKVLTYRLDYCKNTNAPATIAREFLTMTPDGVQLIAQMPATAGQLAVGCHTVTVAVDLPDTLPDGEYRLRVVRTIRVNQLRSFDVGFTTASFHLKRSP